jgi:hypothetical protein
VINIDYLGPARLGSMHKSNIVQFLL